MWLRLLNRYLLLFNTIKYLKPIQIYYRAYYLFRNRSRKALGINYEYTKTPADVTTLNLQISPQNHHSVYVHGTFTLLNRSKTFEKIDWNFDGYGKLWTYNLTYFEYLKDEEDIGLIYDFIDNIQGVTSGLEPFPVSLRGINWIKFLSRYRIRDEKIDGSLYAQYYILLDNLEYHLLGNHLLENGFSLLFGAYYFQDEVLYKKAVEILGKELEEQILDDGAHFELSPMYHQLMLFRLLDCVNLVQNNGWKNDTILPFLRQKAALMLGWLCQISYANGEIPLFNDSARHIAPTTDELKAYAKRLDIEQRCRQLRDSGYRKVNAKRYECVVDIGPVGAEYIPGHAHADSLSFELYVNKKPFIVDSGTGTYETDEHREYERSTAAHNTVEIGGVNSSEVWSGFRVADRARVTILEEGEKRISARHDGYRKRFGVLHTREWSFYDDAVVIEDRLDKAFSAVARFHFHPRVSREDILRCFDLADRSYTLNTYEYAPEFNKRQQAFVLELPISQQRQTPIRLDALTAGI